MEMFGGKTDAGCDIVRSTGAIAMRRARSDASFNRKRRRTLKHFQAFIEDHKPSKLA